MSIKANKPVSLVCDDDRPFAPFRALYDADAASEYLSISRAMLYRYQKSGALPGCKISHGMRRWLRRDLEAFADRLAEECERAA